MPVPWASRPAEVQYDPDELIRKADEGIRYFCNSKALSQRNWDGCVGVGLVKTNDVNFLQPTLTHGNFSDDFHNQAGCSSIFSTPSLPPKPNRLTTSVSGSMPTNTPKSEAPGIAQAEAALAHVSNQQWLRGMDKNSSGNSPNGDTSPGGLTNPSRHSPLPHLQSPEAAQQYVNRLLEENRAAKHLSNIEAKNDVLATMNGFSEASSSHAKRQQQAVDQLLTPPQAGRHASQLSEAPTADSGSEPVALMNMLADESAMESKFGGNGPSSQTGFDMRLARLRNEPKAPSLGMAAALEARLQQLKGTTALPSEPADAIGDSLLARLQQLQGPSPGLPPTTKAPAVVHSELPLQRSGTESEVDQLLKDLRLERHQSNASADTSGNFEKPTEDQEAEQLLQQILDCPTSDDLDSRTYSAQQPESEQFRESTSLSEDFSQIDSEMDFPSAPQNEVQRLKDAEPTLPKVQKAQPSTKPETSPQQPAPTQVAPDLAAQSAELQAYSEVHDLQSKLQWVQSLAKDAALRSEWMTFIAKRGHKLSLSNLKSNRLGLAEACVETALAASPTTGELAVQLNLVALAIQRVKMSQLQQERAKAAVPFDVLMKQKQQAEAARLANDLPTAPKHQPSA